MAAFVTNQSLLASSPCSASLFSKPLKTLEPNIRLLPLSFPFLRHPINAGMPMLGFSSKRFPFSHVSRGNIFKSYLSAEDSSPNAEFHFVEAESKRNDYCPTSLNCLETGLGIVISNGMWNLDHILCRNLVYPEEWGSKN